VGETRFPVGREDARTRIAFLLGLAVAVLGCQIDQHRFGSLMLVP
jgi:hypothetical protein